MSFVLLNFLKVDHTKRQWVDLGIHTEVCMTRPETCGVAGGTICLWVKVVDCENGGIVSTLDPGKTGSAIHCSTENLR